jgi:hypothetical protein
MSNIEKKYREEITLLFNDLSSVEKDILKTLEKESLKESDFIAKLCSEVNKKIDLILKKYYPEIIEISDKIEIKSRLKFYSDLLDKLTDFIKNIEKSTKIDDRSYRAFINFILDKETLINGKYREISTQELTTLHDKKSKNQLEQILTDKYMGEESKFSAMGSLEEEIKKIGKDTGADFITILSSKQMRLKEFNIIENPNSIIHYSIFNEDEEKLKSIGRELRTFLTSKGYQAAILLVEFSDIITEQEALVGSIITDAKLFPDR